MDSVNQQDQQYLKEQRVAQVIPAGLIALLFTLPLAILLKSLLMFAIALTMLSMIFKSLADLINNRFHITIKWLRFVSWVLLFFGLGFGIVNLVQLWR